MVFVFTAVLTLILSAPGALALVPWGYSYLSWGHLAAFVLAVLTLASLGRALRRLHRRPARGALWAGALAGALGAVGTQLIMHTPQATAAFVRNLAPRGIPAIAAVTLLNLHATSGTLLTAAFGAGLYGVVGWIAGWWGGRRSTRRAPTHSSSPGEASEDSG